MNKKLLVIIPARSGSKAIPHKNVKKFKDLPLLVWSIKQAQQSKYYPQMKIFVSTDSAEYANIARKFGAEVPILRPVEISGDHSTDLEFMSHAVKYFKTQNYYPDMIIQLRPTQPCRKIKDIDKCIELFSNSLDKNEGYTSLRTVIKLDKTPYKMYQIKDGILEPMFTEFNGISEPYNIGRQMLPQTYLHNGYIDIHLPSVIESGKLSGEKIYPYIMNKKDIIDIDTMEDWYNAEMM